MCFENVSYREVSQVKSAADGIEAIELEEAHELTNDRTSEVDIHEAKEILEAEDLNKTDSHHKDYEEKIVNEAKEEEQQCSKYELPSCKVPTHLSNLEKSWIKKRAPTFQLSKQHTGMKNRSCGVGMAVMPTNKMEFEQVEPADFGLLKINRPIVFVKNTLSSPASSGYAEAEVEDEADIAANGSLPHHGLTEQGFHDLKFYHNRLW